MEKQIVICCPTYENITKQDLKEIYNLLDLKKRYKEYLKKVSKRKRGNYMSDVVIMREEILRDMNNSILATGDENIFEVWFSEGIPDECDDEIYTEIAEDEDEYSRIKNVFIDLMGKGVEE